MRLLARKLLNQELNPFKTAKNVWDCIAKGFVENAKMAEVMTKNCAAVEEIEVNHVKKLSE